MSVARIIPESSGAIRSVRETPHVCSGRPALVQDEFEANVAFHDFVQAVKVVPGLLTRAGEAQSLVHAGVSLCGGEPSCQVRWWVWWLGDAVGNVVVAPVLLTWAALLRSGRGLPRVGETVPMIAFIVVDLPDALPPNRQTISPAAIR